MPASRAMPAPSVWSSLALSADQGSGEIDDAHGPVLPVAAAADAHRLVCSAEDVVAVAPAGDAAVHDQLAHHVLRRAVAVGDVLRRGGGEHPAPPEPLAQR